MSCADVDAYYEIINQVLTEMFERHNKTENYRFSDIIFVKQNADMERHGTANCLYVSTNIEHAIIRKEILENRCEYMSLTENTHDLIADSQHSSDYLERHCNVEKYDICLLHLDYSLPNVLHITSPAGTVAGRDNMNIIYVPPLIWPRERDHDSGVLSRYRATDIATSFFHESQASPARRRRQDVLNQLRTSLSSDYNVENLQFSTATHQYNLLCNTKILVNVHQTPFHETFEELRCINALACGVIVISEKSLYYENIPYSDFIIWCDYHDIVDTVRDVITNYNSIFRKIHIENDVRRSLRILLDRQMAKVDECIKRAILYAEPTTLT